MQTTYVIQIVEPHPIHGPDFVREALTRIRVTGISQLELRGDEGDTENCLNPECTAGFWIRLSEILATLERLPEGKRAAEYLNERVIAENWDVTREGFSICGHRCRVISEFESD